MKKSVLKEDELKTFFDRNVIYEGKHKNIDEVVLRRNLDIFHQASDDFNRSIQLEKEELSLNLIKNKKKKQEHQHSNTIDIITTTDDDDKNNEEKKNKKNQIIQLYYLDKKSQIELTNIDMYNVFELFFLRNINLRKFNTNPTTKNFILDLKNVSGRHPFQISFTQKNKDNSLFYVIDLVYNCDIYHFYFLQVKFHIFIEKKTNIHPILSTQLYNWREISYLDTEDPLRDKINKMIDLKTKYIQHYYFRCKCTGYQ